MAPEPLVPLDGPIRELAVGATKGLTTAEERARAIYEKVTGMMKYDKSGTGWGRGDAVYACDAKRGNCTDFHALLIGMARSAGIPARFAIGLPIPESRRSGEIPGYHCWAELYVERRGWVPVDSSEASKNPAKRNYFFGHHDENRLEFSRGRHLTLAPAQQGPPLNFFVYPYAEVDGRPHEAIDRSFTFTDRERLSTGSRRPPMTRRKVGILVFPEVEVLDFCGPFEVFSVTRLDEERRRLDPSPYEVLIIAENPGVVVATGGLKVIPDHVLEDCPPLDVLVVPGGWGTRREMKNDRLIAWIAERGQQVTTLTSVCTGALLLGKAGLLDGRRATTHWRVLEEMRGLFPAVNVIDDQHVVEEGNLITSAGISAGIDMALRVVARHHGDAVAGATARYMEYPFPEDNRRRV